MSDKKYTLSFQKALGIVLDGGAARGEEFAPGYFIKLGSLGQIVLVDSNRFYEEMDFPNIKSLSYQKYRELTVMTKKELEN